MNFAATGLLMMIVVYLPYQVHYPVVLPVKGVNMINMLFLLAWGATLAGRGMRPVAAPVRLPLWVFLAAVASGFATALVRGGGDFGEDATYFKNCAFYPLLFFLAYHAIRTEQEAMWVFRAVLFVATLVAVQCIRQGLDYGIGSFSWSKRAAGPFATNFTGANSAAAFFIIYSPLFLCLASARRSGTLARMVGLGGALLAAAGAIFTYSRQAFIAIPALFTLHYLRRSLLLAVAILVLLLNYEWWVPEGVVDRIDMTEQRDEHGQERLDRSTGSRFVLWTGAMQMLAEYPLGVGLARFHREIGRYAPEYANYDAHNAFVLFAAEAGLPGLLALVALLVAMLRMGWRVERDPEIPGGELFGRGLFMATIGLVFSNVFGSRLFNGEVTGLYWIIAGLAAGQWASARVAARAS